MLELRHVKKSYDNVTILEDINLEIQDGEIVSILGPSGCGKTTLLNLVLGLTPADSGEILSMEKILRTYLWRREGSISYFRITPCFRT